MRIKSYLTLAIPTFYSTLQEDWWVPNLILQRDGVPHSYCGALGGSEKPDRWKISKKSWKWRVIIDAVNIVAAVWQYKLNWQL